MHAALEDSRNGLVTYEATTPASVQEFDLRKYVLILRRRWLSILLPVVLVFPIAVIAAYLLPPVYQASAKILVEAQLIPTELAQSTVTANAFERVQGIEQRLMTRDNLLDIIRKFNLYPDERTRKSPSEIVDLMRDAAAITPIDIGAQRTSRNIQVIGFTVSFDYGQPDLASKVANEFVSLILQQNIQSRNGRASETAKFFQQQSDKLAQDLTAIEARIADFKKKNEASLPDSLPYHQTLLLQLQSQLADLDQKIAFAKELPGDTAAGGEALPIQRLNIHLDAAKEQLASATEERDSIKVLVDKGVVSKNHLMTLDRAITAAEADVKTTLMDIEAAKRKAAFGDPTQAGAAGAAQLTAQREDLAQRIAVLNGSIIAIPEVEAALDALTRDHENLKNQYRDATAKVAAAATGEDLEQNRQAERFEVIEQATPASNPVKPNRPKIILLGAFAGLAAGGGMMAVREFLDRSIRTAVDLEQRLKLRPISIIPYLATSADRTRRNWRWILAVILAAVLIATVLALIHWYYMPLDLLIPKLLTKVGLQ